MSVLPEETIRKYERAGEIAAKVREEMRRITKEGMPIIEVCEAAEAMIRNLGAQPAFPCNVSVNEAAAHYTSPPCDPLTVPEGSLVKVDVGVHVDGYIADTAVTVCFSSEHEGMVQAAEAALETAINTIRSGLSTSQLGSEIQRVIEHHGFKPVSNLTGHQVGRYTVHTGMSLPNIAHNSLTKIRVGDVYAIEPFVTVKEAEGRVENGPDAFIFRLAKRRFLKHAEARNLLEYVETRFRTLPFAERWLGGHGSCRQYKPALSELLKSKCLKTYPVFLEASRRRVAQAEHTVYVGKDSPVVLTQL